MRTLGFRKFFWILVLTGLGLGTVPAIVLMDSELFAEDAAHSESAKNLTNSSDKKLAEKTDETEKAEKSEKSEKPGRQDKKSASVKTVVDESVVEDIRKTRDESDQRKKELDKKEVDLNAREKSLNEEMKKLAELRSQISKTQDEKKKEGEEKVNKLVETLLAMSPKAASKVLSTVDSQLAVAAIEKMDTGPLAKIMNVMEPSKSSKLSEMMTGTMKAREESQKAGGQK